jgi:hypothetical protein
MNELLKLTLLFWFLWGLFFLTFFPSDTDALRHVAIMIIIIAPGYRAGQYAVQKGKLRYLVGPLPENRTIPGDDFGAEIKYVLQASIFWIACLACVARMPNELMAFFVLSIVAYLLTILGFYKGVVETIRDDRLASDPNDGPSGR